MSDAFGYQVRKIGEPAGNVWNAIKDSVCAEWAASPEDKEVVERNNFTGETRVVPREEAQQRAKEYEKLRNP
jgi:hypothetical protein